MMVGNHAGEVLARALAHDACLAVMDRKALLEKDGGCIGGKPLGGPVEGFIA
jgi:hypothetical protein